MASHSGLGRVLRFMYSCGLSFPPSGDRDEVIEDWLEVIEPSMPDSSLMWAAKRWQNNGNTKWPQPLQLVTLVQQERNRRAQERRQEQGLQGCARCCWTGTRTVIQHQLHMRLPLHQADIDTAINQFLSEDHNDHLSVEAWAAENPSHVRCVVKSAIVACDCDGGAKFGQYADHREFLERTPPVQEPGRRQLRAVACRQYVTGTSRRYHSDDTRAIQEGGGGPVRWFNQPSPEEIRGPVEGPHFRMVAQKGLDDSVAAELAAMTRRADPHAAARAKANQREMRRLA